MTGKLCKKRLINDFYPSEQSHLFKNEITSMLFYNLPDLVSILCKRIFITYKCLHTTVYEYVFYRLSRCGTPIRDADSSGGMGRWGSDSTTGGLSKIR